MAKISPVKFLQKILVVVWWGLLILTLITVFVPGARSTESRTNIFNIVSILLTSGGYLFALSRLRAILSSIIEKNPFIEENVHRFKQIGYSIFMVGLVDTIITFPATEGALLIGTPYGGVKTRIFVYLIFGLLSLVLAQIFSQAREIKEENELTI